MTNEQQRAAFEAQIELPPLPDAGSYRDSNGDLLPCSYNAQDMKAYALAAYQSARDLALDDAAEACEARIGRHGEGLKPTDVEDCDEEARACAMAIRALAFEARREKS